MQNSNRNYDTFADVAIDIKAFLNISAMPLVMRGLNRAVNDLNLYAFSEVSFKSSIVQVGQSLTAQLPNDCVTPTKVGIWANNGRTPIILDQKTSSNTKSSYERTFNESNGVINPCPSCCGCSDEESVTMLNLPSFSDTNYGALCCDFCTFLSPTFNRHNRIYGKRTTYKGAWIKDKDNNRIILEDVPANTFLVVEYQTSITDRQKTLLPKAAFDMLLNKTATYVFKNDPRLSLSYEEEYKKYKRRFDSAEVQKTFSIEEVVNALSSPRSSLGYRRY